MKSQNSDPRDELLRRRKCVCDPVCISEWSIVREVGDCCVIYCRVCHQAWYTATQYSDSVEREILSEYRWRRIRSSPGYHVREDVEIFEQ
ncbi:MAG: hypothetical protein IJK01_01210 [Clostridia bacterium]|nr:hypothetical protein [Clostridia bacterium]